MGELVRDPRMLPYFLVADETARLCRVRPNTLVKWRRAGRLICGEHFVRRAGRVVYLRDGMLAFMGLREAGKRPAPPPTGTSLNPAHSPAIAAALHREAHGLRH